jgi:hypothetical protein
VLNLSIKISKLSAYIVLLGYLTVTTTYIFHHHTVELGKLYPSTKSSESTKNNHLNLFGSEILCVVQFAYNSLHNSIISIDNPSQNFQTKPEVIDQNLVSTKSTKETIFSFCLRAPPFSIS